MRNALQRCRRADRRSKARTHRTAGGRAPRLSKGGQTAKQTPRKLFRGTERNHSWRTLQRSYDRRQGGFGGARKFPQPVIPHFLFRYYARTGDREAARMAIDTLAYVCRQFTCEHPVSDAAALAEVLVRPASLVERPG